MSGARRSYCASCPVSEITPHLLASICASARYASRNCSASWCSQTSFSLPPFSTMPEPGALAFEPVVAAAEARHRADAREGIGHDGDDGAIAQSFDVRHDYLMPPPCFFVTPTSPRDGD